MERREAIRRTAAIMGGALFAPTLAGLMSGCTPGGGRTEGSGRFTDRQAEEVHLMADILLPRTDTPGAVDVGVPEWIERMVYEIYAEDTRARFLEGLEALHSLVDAEYGMPLLRLSPEMQEEAVSWLNQEMVSGESPGLATGTFRMVKELTLLGYYTSESGATEELRYLPVPGRYEGCVPYEEIGVAWAT